MQLINNVIEECAELTQALCKAQKHGWWNYHPERPTSSNYEETLHEMEDVIEAIEKLNVYMRQLCYEHYKN